MNDGLQQPVRPEVWIPYTVTGSGQRGLLVRTTNDPMALMNDVRREVWATIVSAACRSWVSCGGFRRLRCDFPSAACDAPLTRFACAALFWPNRIIKKDKVV